MLLIHTRKLIQLTESIIAHDTMEHIKAVGHAALQGVRHGVNPINVLVDKYDNTMNPGKQHEILKHHLRTDDLSKTKKGALEAYQAAETVVLSAEAYGTNKLLDNASEKYPTQTRIARNILDKADDIL